MTFDFLVETFATERLKTLSVWVQFHDHELDFRPEARARTPLEQMVHQCTSEEAWMTRMLRIFVDLPALPREETRLSFLQHYADTSGMRLEQLRLKAADWFMETTDFFGTPRSRAWVLVRRIAHTAHHRGQLTTYLRLLGHALYSIYGPTADTGGLPGKGGQVIYLCATAEGLTLAGLTGPGRALPGPGTEAPTERP